MKQKVRELLTKREAELVESGSPANVKVHSADRLKTYIKVTRRLRDKYRELNRRQRLAQRFSSNERTVEKAQLFDQVLNRLEKRYESVHEAS